jgi:two-component system, NarL family, response regulator
MIQVSPIRVLVVDDHPVVRDGIASILNRREDMTVVGEASNGKEAIDLFKENLPDVTLMDIAMPVMGGLEAIETIRKDFPSAKIIVLTTYAGDEDIYRAFQLGAMGYILKEAPVQELTEAIQKVYEGKRHIPSVIAAKLSERISEPELTHRELEVLKLLAGGKSNSQIAEFCHITTRTVKAHISAIISKLNVTNRTEAVAKAIERGFIH